jgi:hypothetical protein
LVKKSIYLEIDKMTKLRNAILALAASLLSTGALAQAVGFTQDSVTVTVAEELFGGGAVELEFADFVDASTPFVPKAKLIFADIAILATTEFSVTYTLHNATLAESVTNKDFMWGSWGAASNARGGLDCNNATEDVDATELAFCPETGEISFERKDGRKGDKSVTFDITVTEAQTNLASPMRVDDNDEMTPVTAHDYNNNVTRKIVLIIPDVEASGLVAANAMGTGATSVMVQIMIEQSKVGSASSEVSELIVAGNMCGAMVMNMNAAAQVACPVVHAHKVITGISNSGGAGTISLKPEDMRMALVPAGRVALSTVTVAADFGMGGVRNAEGEVLVDSFAGSMAGTLAISVASDKFNDGDVVYIDADGDKTADTGELFVIADGVASDSVDLSTEAVTVYYQPSGDVPLTHRSSFAINAGTEFSAADNKNRAAKPAKATLSLDGITGAGVKAYAIAPVGSTDKANVRVTCESSAEAGCRVFFECRDQAGMNTFGEAGAAVGPNMTGTWQQEDIQEALGIDAWEGRLSCNVLATADISVQVLTRAVGVLVNNTSVND